MAVIGSEPGHVNKADFRRPPLQLRRSNPFKGPINRLSPPPMEPLWDCGFKKGFGSPLAFSSI